MYPNDPNQPQPLPPAPQPFPQPAPQPQYQQPQPQYQQPQQPIASVPTPTPTPAAAPVSYNAPTQSTQSGLPLFGIISLALGVIGIILIPILYTSGESYLLLIISLVLGLASVAAAIFALRSAAKIGAIILAGFVFGAIAFSMSLTQLIQSSILSAKLDAYTSQLEQSSLESSAADSLLDN